MSGTRQCHDHRPQIKPRYREEMTQNTGSNNTIRIRAAWPLGYQTFSMPNTAEHNIYRRRLCHIKTIDISNVYTCMCHIKPRCREEMTQNTDSNNIIKIRATWHRGYKAFSMLNSAEHKMYRRRLCHIKTIDISYVCMCHIKPRYVRK